MLAPPLDDRVLLENVQRQVETLRRHGMISGSGGDLIPRWSRATSRARALLIDGNGRLNAECLRNFRRDQVLVPDLPAAPLARPRPANRVVGWRRATINCLTQCLDVLVAHGYDELLRKYPCHPAGNPHVFHERGHALTFAWARHVYCLGLLNRVLGDRLGGDACVLELGGSYGAFGSLLWQEYPGCHYVGVELPEQLIAAHYFLGCCFPGARIAGPADLVDAPVIDRDVIRAFDFVLLPPALFAKVAPGAVDLVASFGSLGEMSPQWFEAYVRSPVYRGARFQYMVNRIAARPDAYHNRITVLDYPVWERGQALHFDVCPIYAVDFVFDTSAFGYELGVPDPHFEYVGRMAA